MGVHHAGKEAGEALDGDLPASGNEVALHSADHEYPEQEARDHHPHRAGGKGNLMIADMEHVEHLLHLELVHRVHFALIRHAIPRLKSCQSGFLGRTFAIRSEEHTSELQSLMRISYAVFCLKKKPNINHKKNTNHPSTTL